MSFLECAFGIERVELERHDWDAGDDDEPIRGTRICILLDEGSHDQSLELSFGDDLALLRAFGAALIVLADHPFKHGQTLYAGPDTPPHRVTTVPV